MTPILRKKRSSRPSILSVSYDDALLQTREWILKAEGFEVTSGSGFVESERLCDKGRYDLLVIGHSIPQQDKIAIIAAFKKRSRAPVISIVRHGDNPLPQADYWTDSTDGPEALVRIVKKALSQSATSQQINKS